MLLLWVLATVRLKGGTAAALHHSLMSRFVPAVLIHALHGFLDGSPQAVFPVFWAAAVYGDLKRHNKPHFSHNWLNRPNAGARYAAMAVWVDPLGSIKVSARWQSEAGSHEYTGGTKFVLQCMFCADYMPQVP